jgi:hypothetical protein
MKIIIGQKVAQASRGYGIPLDQNHLGSRYTLLFADTHILIGGLRRLLTEYINIYKTIDIIMRSQDVRCEKEFLDRRLINQCNPKTKTPRAQWCQDTTHGTGKSTV